MNLLGVFGLNWIVKVLGPFSIVKGFVPMLDIKGLIPMLVCLCKGLGPISLVCTGFLPISQLVGYYGSVIVGVFSLLYIFPYVLIYISSICLKKNSENRDPS